ncbi:MAG: hypothetical protein L6Q59_01000 [Ignavibacteriaceae bacterium]|nr:hypothetical protein [Ignavibacteriaceae bacterium]
MRYTYEMRKYREDGRYHLAEELLENIINGTIPSEGLVRSLFGESKTRVIKYNLDKFITSREENVLSVRPHHKDAPTDISDSRSAIESDTNFQTIHSTILLGDVPPSSELAFYYHDYSHTVRGAFKLFSRHKLVRKCGVPTIAHANRVGTLSTAIGLNDDQKTYKYSAVAAMHDLIEDLLFTAKDKTGKPYGFENYQQFLDDFIPSEIQDEVKILTNHYDLIVKFVTTDLKKRNEYLSFQNILASMYKLIDNGPEQIRNYAAAAYNLLCEKNFETDILDAIRWECYKELYIEGIASASKEARDYRLYEIKSFDLSDNGHGLGSLSNDSKIRNLIKQEIWARKGYRLETDWEPINRRIMELMEDTLVYAKHLVVKDLLEPQSSQDYIVSALKKFEQMKSIFYVEKVKTDKMVKIAGTI